MLDLLNDRQRDYIHNYFVLFVEYSKEKRLPTFGLNANKIAWNSQGKQAFNFFIQPTKSVCIA